MMFRSMLTVALTLAPVALAADADPITALAESESKAALAAYNSPRGAAHLIRLHGLRDEVSDFNLLAQTYNDLLAKRAADPLTRATARILYADVERARGRLHKAQQILDPLGFIHGYYVLGSFDNEGKSGCDTDFGPEASLDLKATYPTKWRESGWRKLTQEDPDGYVDLASVVRPNKDAVAYALTFLDAPQETRTTLSVGVSGAYRLWVNGQLAAKENRYNLPRPDQSRVAVKLRKGTNRILLKVCQENGPLGFYLRQERGDGVASAQPSLPDTLPALEKGTAPQAQPLPTLTTLLEREVKAHPDDTQLRGDYATILHYFRAFDSTDHTDTAEAERAADAAPKDASLQLLAAQMEEEDHNLRRKHLEAAVAADPTSPLAQLELARHEIAMGFPERALPALKSLLAAHPDFAPAVVALSQAHDALGEWPEAVDLVEGAFRRMPAIPSLVREAARVSRRLDRPQDALARFHVALALRFDDVDSRRALVSLLADTGRVEEAARELEVLLKLDPFDNGSRLHLAELLAANGKLEDAKKLFAEANALAPDEPEVHEREGRALLEAGQRPEAIAAFKRSLELRPQNPALKEVLRSLEGANDSPGAQFALDPKPLVAEADALPNEDAVYLVDGTYVRVQSNGLSSRFHQMAVKVYTQRGVEGFRTFPINYSPNRQEVRIVQARITKPDGSIVESYGDQDKNTNEPWTGMYYDARVKILSFPQLSAGDVLEVEYRLDDTAQDNLLSDYWGDVDYVQTINPKVRYQYIADMPQGRALYWNKSRLPATIRQTSTQSADGRTLYTFAASSVPKVVPEPGMPGWAEVVTTLHVSTYQTWEQVGRYYWGLVRDQLTPNDDLKKTVEKVLQGVDRKDDLAVIRALYDFVVTNTRYVALEFGIHGYKPYRVDRVLARRFGDCKDKASLMNAMLKVAGIDSRLVLLRMRHLGDIGAEPASLAAFNHAILYVPKYQLFLDGTAEFHGAKELPTADRFANALIIDPDGKSTFLTTPEGKAEDNLTRLSLDVALKADGSASLKGDSVVVGEAAPQYRQAYQAADTRKSTFEQGWSQTFPGLTVEKVVLNDLTQLDKDVSLDFDMQVPRYAEVLPNALRFYPFGSGRSYTQTYAPLSERHFDLVLPNPWVNHFTFKYPLPAGYTAKEIPPDVSEQTPFGRMKVACRMEGENLLCEGEIALAVARVKAQDYPAFRAFLGRVDQVFGRKVLVTAPSGQTAEN